VKIGIIGSGMIGGTLARRFVEVGHEVLIANSRGPQSLQPLVSEIGANMQAATVEGAAAAELVVLAVPFKAIADLPGGALAGKVVVDAGNYYPGRDGRNAELENGTMTSGELTARILGGSRVVKAFNTLYFQRLLNDGRPAGAADRLAVLLAGDDAADKAVVAALVDQIGFDPVDTGSLAEGGRRQGPDSPAYNRALTRAEVVTVLGLDSAV
jgi:predicted dinucleotide-binding enzyme